MRRQLALARAAAALLVAAGIVRSDAASASDPDVLWKIVHGKCVASMQAAARPAPCERVDMARDEAHGFAVLKDIEGRAQYLLIPTAKITGIESPQILAPDATNYFARAWDASPLVGQALHVALPRQDLALAINSVNGRTQNQLHIHLDCIRRPVRRALDRMQDDLGAGWRMLPERLRGHRYRAMWLPGADLGDRDPFRLLAASLADPANEMGLHTLVLVGAVRHGQPGYLLLDGQSGRMTLALAAQLKFGPGSGEELEDHLCRIAPRT